MKIDQIKIWPVKNNKALKAKADVTLSTEQGEISIKGFRIVQMNDGVTFVASPQEKYQVGSVTKYKDLLWLDRAFQAFLYSKIIGNYKDQTAPL